MQNHHYHSRCTGKKHNFWNNLNRGKVAFSTNKKIESYLCPNVVRGNGGGKHSIKGSKQNTANCGPLASLIFCCLVPALPLPSFLSPFNISNQGRGISFPVLHLSWTCSSPTHGQEFPFALVLKFHYHIQSLLPELFTRRNTVCMTAFDNTDSAA